MHICHQLGFHWQKATYGKFNACICGRGCDIAVRNSEDWDINLVGVIFLSCDGQLNFLSQPYEGRFRVSCCIDLACISNSELRIKQPKSETKHIVVLASWLWVWIGACSIFEQIDNFHRHGIEYFGGLTETSPGNLRGSNAIIKNIPDLQCISRKTAIDGIAMILYHTEKNGVHCIRIEPKLSTKKCLRHVQCVVMTCHSRKTTFQHQHTQAKFRSMSLLK